jgi:hypothetical protein
MFISLVARRSSNCGVCFPTLYEQSGRPLFGRNKILFWFYSWLKKKGRDQNLLLIRLIIAVPMFLGTSSRIQIAKPLREATTTLGLHTVVITVRFST